MSLRILGRASLSIFRPSRPTPIPTIRATDVLRLQIWKCVPVLAACCGATGKPWGSCSSLQRTPSSPPPLQPLAFSALVDSFRPEGHFLEEALIDDNANLETITKIASSGAQNRCIRFAITTLLEAKLSAAQNGAIQGPLIHNT